MNLRFIYGRAGTGKSQHCLNEIKLRLYSQESDPLVLLVPEMFTFQTEKNLLMTIDKDINFRTSVLSFRTMANRVFTEVGGLTKVHMKPCGRAMLIYRIMDQVKDSLKVFSKSARQHGFINTISEIITELKRFEVTPELVREASTKVDNVLLREKINDIALIFSAFEKSLHENYIDSEDEVAMLGEKLDLSHEFDGAEIWLDGFTGFTPQQYGVIEKLLKKAKRINVTLCTDYLCGKSGYDKTDLFSPSRSTEERLLRLCEENNISLDEPVNLNEGPVHRFSASRELSYLEENLYSFPCNQYLEETKDIRLFKAVNIYSEVEEAAREILRLVRDENMRFSDITVAARDLSRYEKLARAIFTEHGIPYFIDQKREIRSNPIIVLITSAVEIYTKRWSYESVFRYLKTGLLDIDREDINILENYVLASGIRGRKWLEGEWDYRVNYMFDKPEMTEDEKGLLSRVNEIRSRVSGPIKEFHSRLSGKIKVKDICRSLYEFLIKIGVPGKIESMIDSFREENELDLVKVYSQVWEIVVDVLDQMTEVMGEDTIDLDQFVKILTIGFDEYKIGVVPPALDQVLVSSIDRMKSHNAKALLLIGVNDGIFPAASTDEGILTDSDRESLKSIGLELDHDSKTKTFEEQFLVYTALTSSRKYLRLSYSIADHEGKTMRPSAVISRIKKIFPNISEKSNIVSFDTPEENLNLVAGKTTTFNEMVSYIKRWETSDYISPVWLDVYRWYMRDEDWIKRSIRTLKGLNYSNQVRIINQDRARKLYGDKMYFSISRLEKYVECPFAYYVQYGLKAKERKQYSFNPPDMGTFLHNVIDEFSRVLEKEGTNWREIDRDFCRDAISIIVDNMIKNIPGFILNSTPRYMYLSERLKRMLTSAIWVITEHIRRSSFEPLGYEVDFGNSGKYPPIKITLPTGEEINLIGRIDRVDQLEREDGHYIRIIDYKSGNKDLTLSDIYHGLQVQLLVYLDAILQSAGEGETKLHPAGMLYFKLDDPIIKSKVDLADEELKAKIFKKLKMKGYLLKDADIVREMDKTIEGESMIIPANIKNDGSLGAKTKGATREQFELLREHIKKAVADICSDMVSGNIIIRPYKRKKKIPCDFCKFTAICQFDSGMKDNSYNLIHDKKDEEIWNLLSQEVKLNE